MPQSLNCPTCGAPASGVDATRCAYCGSTLTYAACPKCFGAMFVGMGYCPHCGTNFTRATLGDSPTPCPSCKTPMAVLRIGNTPLLECGACHGTWLDATTFTDLCS